MKCKYDTERDLIRGLGFDRQVTVLVAHVVECAKRQNAIWGWPLRTVALTEARHLTAHLWGCCPYWRLKSTPGAAILHLQAEGYEQVHSLPADDTARPAVEALVRFAHRAATPRFDAFRQEFLQAAEQQEPALHASGLTWATARVYGIGDDMRSSYGRSDVGITMGVVPISPPEDREDHTVAAIYRWYAWGEVPRMREAVAGLAAQAIAAYPQCRQEWAERAARDAARREQAAAAQQQQAAAKYAEDCPLLAWAHV